MIRRLCVVALLLLPAAAMAAPGDDWITVNKDYRSQRYVDLGQITKANVNGLKEACEIQLNEPSWFSSGILKVGRALYFTDRRMTYAVDATNCKPLWRNIISEAPYPVNYNSRGLAYLDGMLYRGTTTNKLIAIDAATGTTAWTQDGVPDPTGLASIVAAPIAWKLPSGQSMVFVGNATADLGVSGQISAFNANNAAPPLWTTNTLIAPPPGLKGGAFWTSTSLDPDTGELFVAASNPMPDYSTVTRPGDNKQTDSVISLNAATGQINWSYQAVAADYHDWDLAVAPTLYSVGSRKLLAVSGKDGFVYGLDRSNPSQTLFKTAAIPLKNVNALFPQATSKASPTAAVQVCPGTIGGNQFTGPAYSPQKNALYVGMNDWCWYYFAVDTLGFTRPDYALRKPPRGTITALNAETGAILWQHRTDAQVQAGLVATASGVIFAADTLGMLLALDADDGTVLKTLNVGGAVNSGLISYDVDGTQYVAAEVGGLSLNAPGITDPLRPGGPLRVKVFALSAGTPVVHKLGRIPTPATVPPPVPHDPRVAMGETIYNVVCSACHNQAGGGGPYPPLAVQQYALTDVERFKHFLETVAPPMPKLYEKGKPSVLGDYDIIHLVDYFKSLNFPVQTGYRQPTSPGAAEWPKIYSVLTYPRCINCHTMTDTANNASYPRQDDNRHPHHYGVLRGDPAGEGHGTAIAPCTSCHLDANDDRIGVPGAPKWALAPLSMAWESAPNVAMNGGQLCEVLKNKSLNGGRDLNALLTHISEDNSLVSWAFAPGKHLDGTPRSVPPLSRAQFIAAFTTWVGANGPCPPGPQASKRSAAKRR
ncbi:MAG TPA: PQQ-binding-like beta-propeller repeat protein [Rhizomicrobium sp.]|nr:PQQ-binding-like beta-propeller repeat protein [Rhizomicrobium sp.]